MDWHSRVRAAFVGRSTPDDDVVEELAGHAVGAYESARADGASADEAMRQVAALLAGWAADPAVARRRPRRPPAVVPPPARASALAGIGSDLRYAAKLLARQWGPSLVVVLTLALGVGASTVLFSVAYGVLLRPLPYPEADRLVRLYETREGSTRPATFVTNATYLAWQQRSTTIEGLGAWSSWTATLTEFGEPERVRISHASPSLFAMLGAGTTIGRLFQDRPGHSGDRSELILSYGLWQQRFGGDPKVLGRVVQLDGSPYEVIGVTAREFVFLDRETRAYTPFHVPPAVGADGKTTGGLSMFTAVARLKPGMTVAQAAAEATAAGRHAPDPGLVVMAVFGSRGPVQVTARPLSDAVVGEVRPAVIVLLVAVGLLLVTATANVASLQLARATSRRREMAIRAAIGAGLPRLVRQLLAENAVVGQLGGLVGLACAAVLVRLLPVLLPADFPRVSEIGVDWRMALFAVGVSLVASLVFGLAPVWHVRHVQLAEALAEDGLAPAGVGGRTSASRMRLAIMTLQVAIAAVLLIGAALLARSFVAMMHADQGYDTRQLLTARLPMPEPRFTDRRRAEVLDRIVERVQQVPGVVRAAYASKMPLGGVRPGLASLGSTGETLGAFPVPARRGGGTVTAHAGVRFVSPGYFTALGVRLVEGRAFVGEDAHRPAEVAIVNRTFAQQYLDHPAVGAQLPGREGTREVVGVVDDVTYGKVTDRPQPEIYLCVRSGETGFGESWEPSLLVRTAGDPRQVGPVLRSILREQDQTLVPESVMTMEERVWTSLTQPRLYAGLLAAFALFAVSIAGVGLFGVLSYSVAQRSREIGVRTSLGATPWDIAAIVLRQAMAVTLVGLALGLALSAALGRYMANLLYGVKASDPLALAVVGLALLVVAAVACLVPARRAASVDPVKVLR